MTSEPEVEMFKRGVGVALLLAVSALSTTGCASDSCESARPDLCGGGGSGGVGGLGNGSILGPSPATYVEMDEAGNSRQDSGEATGYVLESANGLEISGSFESDAAAISGDSYVFNSADFGDPGSPGFPGVNIRVFIDGDEITALNQGISLGLDTVEYMGYSSLFGAYFINGALFSNEDYVLSLSPGEGVAGSDYTIEVRGNIPE